MAEVHELDPNSITIGARQRQEASDVAQLEESVARIGFLQPIVITRAHELIAGCRRLQVAINLGLPIPIVYRDELKPLELKKLELEENAKRSDLSWKDQARAIWEIHALNVAESRGAWSIAATARSVGFTPRLIYRCLRVWEMIDDSRISGASNLEQAEQILQRINERKAASIVGDILSQGNFLFGNGSVHESKGIQPTPATGDDAAIILSQERLILSGTPEGVSSLTSISTPPTPSLLNLDFISWSVTYTGPKFNLIHCDFPYGTDIRADKRASEYDSTADIYDQIFNAFCLNFDRFTSYSAHILFWFSMTTYAETKRKLEGLGLWVYPYPLIHALTDGARIVPVVGKTPRRSYHTAFLATRGERPTVKTINDSYCGPLASKPIHPTQKPEPMLKHFLSLVVDETTALLDPTCGSGSSLIAAESLGAQRVLGLELDPQYFKAAEANLNQTRALRKLSGS